MQEFKAWKTKNGLIFANKKEAKERDIIDILYTKINDLPLYFDGLAVDKGVIVLNIDLSLTGDDDAYITLNIEALQTLKERVEQAIKLLKK